MSNYKYTETIGEHTVTLETDDADFMEDYIAKDDKSEMSGDAFSDLMNRMAEVQNSVLIKFA